MPGDVMGGMTGGMTTTFDSVTMGWEDRPAPQSASTLAAPEQWFLNFATGNPLGEAGPAVNEFTAYNYLTVYACVSLIASKIAELPLVTYRADGDVLERATDRSEYQLLLTEFNPSMSALSAREAGIAHLLTWGNSFTQIVRNKSGTRVLQLVPLGPDVTKVRRTPAGEVAYDVFRRGTAELLDTLGAEEILHVPGLSFDGLVGYSPIRVAKTAIRAGMAQDREGEKFVTRGIRPPGAVKFPAGKKFGSTAEAIQYRDNFRRIHSTEDGALNILVLEDGAEWQELGLDPESAQFLETRKFSKKEICGMYRVPPFLVGDVESSSSWGTGIGEQKQGFVDYCLMSWIARVEVEYKRKLGRDDPDVYYRHDTDQLLRGDFAKRSAAMEILHRRGVVSDNEWRQYEHRNPVAGGNVRHFSLAEGRIDEDGNELVPAGESAGGDAKAPAGPTPEPAEPTDPADPKPDAPVGASPDTAKEAAQVGDVQSTALNGAQITSLLLLTDKVAAGQYTAEAGAAILQASFPLMDKALIATMIRELSENVPETPADGSPAEEATETPAEEVVEPPDPGEPVPPPADEKAARLAGKLRKILVAAAGRCLRKEAAQARAAAERPEKFVAWVEEFYARHAEMVADHTGAVAETWAESFGGAVDYPARHVERSRSELLAASEVRAHALAESVERVVSRWTSERLVEVAGEFQIRN